MVVGSSGDPYTEMEEARSLCCFFFDTNINLHLGPLKLRSSSYYIYLPACKKSHATSVLMGVHGAFSTHSSYGCIQTIQFSLWSTVHSLLRGLRFIHKHYISTPVISLYYLAPKTLWHDVCHTIMLQALSLYLTCDITHS